MAPNEVMLAGLFAALALAGPTRVLSVGRVAPWLRVARAHLQAEQQRRETLVARLVPTSSGVRTVEETAGLRRLLWGPARVEHEGARYAFGDGLAPAGLVDATPVARGWVFRTVRGTLLASETFLGPLRALRVPGARCLEPVIHPSHGRAVVRTNAFFVTDGEDFTRVDPPTPALAVAFGTPTWGLAILEGGALAETRDGARTWRPLTAPVARGVALRGIIGGVVVSDANGSQHLLQGGLDTPRVRPSRALRGEDPAMRRALVAHRDPAALRVFESREERCGLTPDALHPSPFGTFVVDTPDARVEGAGTQMRETGGRTAALSFSRDAVPLIFGAGVARALGEGERGVHLRWRLLGDPVARAATVERGSLGAARIDVLAATRVGLLIGGTGGYATPVWATGAGSRFSLPMTVLAELGGRTSVTTSAVATEDGGFVLYAPPPQMEPRRGAFDRLHDEPEALARHHLLRCGSTGCDSFEWYGQDGRAAVRAVGHRGAIWGLVVEGASGVSFVTPSGAERLDVDLAAEPTLCGASRGAVELHVRAWRGWEEGRECPASIGPGLDSPGFARCAAVVYEVQGRALCVRRVEGVRGDDSFDYDFRREHPPAGVWFDARGASFVGGTDDGHTIRSVRAVLRAWAPNEWELE
ncbi:MAG: hypothetical protein U0325_26020 [Polyangiales bacterium]